MMKTTWFGPNLTPTREGRYEILTWLPDQGADAADVTDAYWFDGAWWWRGEGEPTGLSEDQAWRGAAVVQPRAPRGAIAMEIIERIRAAPLH